MAILRLTLDSLQDLGDTTTRPTGAPGSQLLPRISLAPSVAEGAVHAEGLHAPLPEDLRVGKLPWSIDLVDPTEADPTGWGWEGKLWPVPHGTQVLAFSVPFAMIADTSQHDGVRTIRIEDCVGLSSGPVGTPLVRPGQPGPQGDKGDTGDVTAEAQEAATQAASSASAAQTAAAASASSASAAQTAAAASAASAQDAQLAARISDTGWLPMDSWNWVGGFEPAQHTLAGMSPIAYRVYGRRVIIDGGVRHTNTNVSEVAAFLVPAELRPKTHPVFTRQPVFTRFDGMSGNVNVAGVGESEFTYVHIEWLLDKADDRGIS